ncbi:hypothetical protein E2C01_036736 [Portunus trituberculatus]|uniref:Uncharacterized protein n=1 Tax=Portunus trituberculatus TaxID=210409 RepID=A0A5B7FCW3_PORTR|nr:hypothetical protein [Portunus trituberculatus]
MIRTFCSTAVWRQGPQKPHIPTMVAIVKAVAAMAVVVVTLEGPGVICGAAHNATNCTSTTDNTETLVRSKDEELIYSVAISKIRWNVIKYMYMVPLIGFEGVRAEVTTNMGTFPAWFPIMDHCTLDNTQWWQVIMEVNKHTSSTLNVTLTVHNCLLSCELTTGAQHTSGSNVKIQNLEVFGRGTSRWKTDYPPYPCQVQEVATHLTKVNPSSCADPPPIGSVSPRHFNAEVWLEQLLAQQPAQQAASLPIQKPTHQPAKQPTQQPGKGTLSTTLPPPTPSNSTELRAHFTGILIPTLLGLAMVIVVVMAVIVMVVTVVRLRARRRDQRENYVVM